MTNVDVIKNKVNEVQSYLNQLLPFKKYSQEQFLKDLMLKAALERYLYLICQSTIDLGEALISFSNSRSPSTYGEIFEILKTEKIINQVLSIELQKMTGFRNILAHSYGKVNFDIVYQVLIKDLNVFQDFLHVVKQKFTS